MMPYREGGEWEYPPTTAVLEEAGMYSMEHYINVRRNKLVDYVATRPIGGLLGDVERLSGSARSQMFWFNQETTLADSEEGW